MKMESPVRIYLGAALVVNILLLSTTVSGNAVPQTTSSTVKDDRISRHNRLNSTLEKNRSNTPDISMNELNPKESTSEEHTEKNAKYKDRGRVRFHSQLKSSTESPLRKVNISTGAANLIIVTPTPEVKRPAEIIDSMKAYKKNKIKTVVSSSSTTPMAVREDVQSVEEYDNEEEEDEKESFDFTSSKFHDSNFFTMPSFDDDENERSDNKVKQDFSSPSYGFSSFFPKETSYNFKEHSNDNSFKSNNFFDFDTDLTTPKNDFFDKKYQEISGSIIKNLDIIKSKSSPPNVTNVHKIVKENVGLERLSNNTPSNKSTVFMKNTKEIHLIDNDSASSTNKELSDVHGTSIYYEMSVLSTETYINHSEDNDCDNDSLPLDPTPSTSSEEEIASITATEPILIYLSTKPPFLDLVGVSTLTSNFLPISSAIPVAVSTQNSISSTERVPKIFSSSFSRNGNYSKVLNFTGIKDSPNSVTSKADVTSYRPQLHKFYNTSPRIKPIWMSPRRNITRLSYARPTNPTTIYSEHFDIRDKLTTKQTLKQQSKATLTTVSSEIDPVLQSDISGPKKVVHSQSISDNSIPSLWKRGSTKFATSTATSSEAFEMEIPPTSIAWALAGLRFPSSVNSTGSTKSIDENELQKVGEVIEKKEMIKGSTKTTTPVSSDIVSKKISEVEQNKLAWRPIFTPSSSSSESDNEVTPEAKSENLAAESNISFQSSAEPVTIETVKMLKSNTKVFKPAWIPATVELDLTTEKFDKEIPPIDAKKSTGFESITKLPSDVTTPQDETAASFDFDDTATEETPGTTTDYAITTIRFSYIPTETVDITERNIEDAETTTWNAWHPVIPTRTKMTTIKYSPITTYRPKYMTTTDIIEESTTVVDTTPAVIEVSSQILVNVTEKIPEITETFELTTVESTTLQVTTETTTVPTTTEIVTEQTTIEMTTQPTTTEFTTQPTTTTATSTTMTTPPLPTTTVTTTTEEETETIIVEVVTSINTERERKVITTPSTITETEITEEVTEENSNSNELITQDIKPTMEPTTTVMPTTERTTQRVTTEEGTTLILSTEYIETTTQQSAKIFVTTEEDRTEIDFTTKAVNDLEDLTSYAGDVTTEASSRVLTQDPEESGSGAAVAIAVSTIGVIALVLLIGLLLVVRRRGRRGVYAQRCTPVSLDAYSLDSVSVGHRKGNNRLRASKRSYGNPAYDDEVTSHPMQYAALASFALDIESMTSEFAEIPSVTVRPEEVPPGCEDKNRYSNVLPLPETRVPLSRIGNDHTTEYINANYITGPGNIRNYYIACQAPLSNTVVDFWRMIWEQNSRLIVMLTEYMENGVEKCYEYLPPSEISDNKRIFGDFKVILKKREQHDKYAISSVQLINLNTRTWREITHLWYFWPAKGVPDDYDSIIDFLSEMRSYMKISQTAKEYDEEGVEVIYGDQTRSSFNNLAKLRSEDSGSGNGVNVYSPAKAEEFLRITPANNGTLGRMKAASEAEGVRPCVVTCASGAGRAALLVALDVCARALAAGAGRADVPRVVRHLRAQRPHSLSNRHHYILLYKVLSVYGNKLMGGVDTI